MATSFPPGRVRFLAADFTADKSWGLLDDTYEQLLGEATLFIHVAWPVDFNLPLSAFRPPLDGLVNIAQFCKAAAHSPSLLFVSSIAAVMGLKSPSIPEGLVQDVEATTSGYGQSKFVAEHVLYEASRSLGVQAGVVRVGQVSGAAHTPGQWNSRDLLLRMLMSSIYLAAVPDHLRMLHNIDWIPIDTLARVILDVSMTLGRGSRFEVYHAINPNTTTWAKLLPGVIRALEGHDASNGLEVARVNRSEWVERLRNSAARFEDGDADIETHNPALKLIDFFEDILRRGELDGPTWSTEATAQISESLRTSQCIQPEWMERWVKDLLVKN